MAEATQPRSRATRKRLVDATIKTLVEKGYRDTSMPNMCKKAGLSRGAQLHHFPKKSELLGAAIESLMEQRHEELRKAVRGQLSGDRATVFTDLLYEIYVGPTFYAWLELAVVARTDKALKKQLTEVNERFYVRAIETLREFLPLAGLGDDELLVIARFITSFMNGLAINRIPDEDDALTLKTLELFKVALAHVVQSVLEEGAS